jgi:hypothetical protein
MPRVDYLRLRAWSVGSVHGVRIAWWKWLGLAGLAGVAATGVVAARDERRRRAYTPEEIRTRLHARVAEERTAEADANFDKS